MRMIAVTAVATVALFIGFVLHVDNNRDAVAASGYSCGYSDALHRLAQGVPTPDAPYCDPYRDAAKRIGDFP